MVAVSRRMDLLRLAGIRTVLGVDVTENRARVVSLTRTGWSINKYSRNFQATGSLSVEFDAGMTVEEKGLRLRESLVSKGIHCRYAVGCVRSRGIKIVAASVPVETEDVSEWIRDNYEKLVKVPIPLESIVFRYEVLHLTESGRHVEVTFVRKDDIRTCEKLFVSAGLDLIALAAGPRDALNSFMIGDQLGKKQTFIYADEESTVQIEINEAKSGPLRAGTFRLDTVGQGDVVSGKYADASAEAFRPFGLSSSFTLASGLAIKGFLPEISPMNFLDEVKNAHFAASVHRSLIKRSTFAYATVLSILLAVPVIAGFALQSMKESLEEQLVESGPVYQHVSMLEQQVRFLEEGLSGKDAITTRSSVARTLQEVAFAAPESLWLARLRLERDTHGESTILLTGYTRSNELVAEFLRRLQARSRDVSLVRSGSAVSTDTFLPSGVRSTFTVFEIRTGFHY